MKKACLIMVLAAAMSSGCATPPPELPSAANVRKSLNELAPADKVRVFKPTEGDLDAIVLRADHEFLACGGDQVGRAYSYVLKKQPNHIRANLGMGEWYTIHRKYQEAVPHLEAVMALADQVSPEYRQAEKVLEFARYKLKQR